MPYKGTPEVIRQARRRYYLKNKENILRKAKAWRESLSDEGVAKLSDGQRRWVEKNRALIRQWKKDWVRRHPEKVLEYRARWRERNPYKYTLQKAKSSLARMVGVPPSSISDELAEAKVAQLTVLSIVGRPNIKERDHAAYMRAWNAMNRDRINERRRQKWAQNSDEMRAQQRQRRAAARKRKLDNEKERGTNA